jgi:hypothetical protein
MASTLDPRTEPSQDLATHDGPVISAEPGRFDTILRPLRAFRLRYVPVVMVYFAYGALGLIDVTRDLWIKESLSFTPSQLAGIAVWLMLPWTVKMVFGELVDTVPIFGSQRKSYVLLGAALMAAGLFILAGTAGRWLHFAKADHLYVLGAMLIAIGTVVQDVVADAMSTEVVSRTDAEGNERSDNDVRVELGMVQVLGRLAVSAGVLAVAGLSGWLANFMPRQDVFLVGLIIPAISVAGVFLRGTETMERRPIDWRILGGGIVFGVVVVVLGVSGVLFAQEIIFIISMAVVCYMLVLVTAELDHNTRMGILFATIIVFAFRAATKPSACSAQHRATTPGDEAARDRPLEVRRDQNVSNLCRARGDEMQAEVDKFIVSHWLLRRQAPGHFPLELRRVLFERAGIDPNVGSRAGLYREASGYAGRFCRHLERALQRARREDVTQRQDGPLLAELRRFYRFTTAAKRAHIEQSA